MTDESESAMNRRRFLAGSGSTGLATLLAGCSEVLNQVQDQEDETSTQPTSEFTRIGDDWLTFGAADSWGMHYNQSRREFELVHAPFEKNSRSNIRIEADENGDKGDVYIDDSLIVKNEFETSSGSETDPGYTFTGNNNTGFYQPDTGAVGVTCGGKETAVFDNGTTRVSGDVTATDRSNTTVWDGTAGHSPNLPSNSVSKSGDGSSELFSLPHLLGTKPSVATVSATSADAAGEFWVRSKSQDAVEIKYSSPPPNGQNNLSYDLIVSQ